MTTTQKSKCCGLFLSRYNTSTFLAIPQFHHPHSIGMARHGVGTNGTGLGLHVTGLGLHVTGLGVHVTELEPMARGSVPGGLFFLGCPTCPTCPTTPKFQITLSKMNAQIIIHRQKESAGFRFLCSRHYTKKTTRAGPLWSQKCGGTVPPQK